MIIYAVDKLAQNSAHFIRGLVKHVSGRAYFPTVPSENRDKIATSPTPQSWNDSSKGVEAVVEEKVSVEIEEEGSDVQTLMRRLLPLYCALYL